MKKVDRIIYVTINKINNKIYIGQSIYNIDNYIGSGKILKQAILKYGRINFEKVIIEHCSSNEELDIREKFWINKLNTINEDIGYNILPGGKGNAYFDYIKNMSNACKGEKNGMYGKHHTIETIQKMRKAAIGRKVSEEAKKKMSESRKGKNNAFYGRTHSDKSLKLMSKNRVGKNKGKDNVGTKKFIFISPNNKLYNVFGFVDFCKIHKLSVGKMKRFIDKGIIKQPKILTKIMTKESLNCIGWKVKHDL